MNSCPETECLTSNTAHETLTCTETFEGLEQSHRVASMYRLETQCVCNQEHGWSVGLSPTVGVLSRLDAS